MEWKDFLKLFICTFILKCLQLMYYVNRSDSLMTLTWQEVHPGESLGYLLRLGSKHSYYHYSTGGGEGLVRA